MTTTSPESLVRHISDPMLSRRALLRRAALLGLMTPAATALLAACGGSAPTPTTQAATTAAASPPAASATAPAASPSGLVYANPPVAATVGNGKLAATQELLYPNTEPPHLDPNLMSGRHEILVGMSLFDPLVSFDSKGQPVPLLAEKWETSTDGTQYTFHIRQGVKWSDGQPVTAHDFEYSWKRALTPSLASDYATALYPVKGALDFNTGKNTDPNSVQVKATDDATLQVTTEHSSPYFLHLCSTWTYLPVPKWAVDKSGDKWVEPGNIVTCGMFKLQDWKHDQQIVLVRNEDYWGTKPTLTKITFPVSADPFTTSVKDYEANALDVTDEIGPADITRLTNDATYSKQLHHFAWSGTAFVVFDCGNTASPVSKPEVRQALYLATDHQTLTRDVLKGLYDPALTVTPPDILGYNPGAAPTGGVAAAKQKLAAAGYPDGKGFPGLKLAWPADARYDLVAQALQQMWKTNLGIDITLQRMESKAFNAATNSWKTAHFESYISRWGSDYSDPYNWYPILWSSAQDIYSTRWHNAEYDAQVQKADRELDDAKRKADYEQAETMLMQGMPVLPLYHLDVNAMVRPYVDGFADPVSATQWWGLFGRVKIMAH
ncbi:MAG TPA: peptide ABC transporter substrate-binding protein [Thermomicrobiales bacterium]|nr:peptide ABC transporter substrate-binding protein [Thermomicrobiales bacterium]